MCIVGTNKTDIWHLTRVTKGLAIISPTIVYWLCVAPDKQFWWKPESRCTFSSVVSWTAVVLGFLDTIRVTGHPFQIASSGIDSYSYLIWLVSYHSSRYTKKGLLSWSQMNQWDARQQIDPFWTLIRLPLCCVDCNIVCTTVQLIS